MAERSGISLLNAFIPLLGESRRERELLCDIILMAVLADGMISQTELDGIAKTLNTYDEFDGLQWDWVMHRAQELREDAPLFFDTREALVQELTDPRLRVLGLTLAAQIVSAERPLEEEERALLDSLGQAFEIPEPEREVLLSRPSELARDIGFFRGPFNDPTQETPKQLFDAIANSADAPELRALMYKLGAIRKVMDNHLEGEASILGLGETMKMGPLHFRVDALIELEKTRYLLRCLADGEALHPEEHKLLRLVVNQRMAENAMMWVVHQGVLSPADESMLEGLEPSKFKRLKVQ